jgi:hypothetical protein
MMHKLIRETKSGYLNSGERIPRRLCRGVIEQRNKEALDGIACPTVRQGFPAALGRGVSILS